MTSVERMRVLWTGFKGGPGVSTLYFNDAASAQGDVGSLFSALTSSIPAPVVLQVEAFGDTITVEDGAITGTWVGTPTTPMPCTTTGPYPGPAGGLIEWKTAGVVARRRVSGKTFLVPLDNGQFGADGTLLDTFVTALITAAQGLVAAQSGNFKVWARPQIAEGAFTDRKGVVHPARAARAGSIHDVLGARVPDKAVVLRSRRD